ncbi:MAG: AI-2E family transporter [Clostridiales bacterium]|nr:AI-2E family transporter [Clostridiales bacterium]
MFPLKTEWKNFIRAGVTLFLLYLCIHHWPDALKGVGMLFNALKPVVIGFILAYILNILLCFYEKHLFRLKTKRENKWTVFMHNRRRGVCVFLAVLTLVVLITVILLLVIPQLVACVELLIEKLPGALDNMIQSLLQNQWLREKGWIDEIELFIHEFDWQARLRQFSSVITGSLGSAVTFLTATITTTVSGVVTGFLALIFAFYMLVGKDRLLRQGNAVLDRFVKPKYCGRIRYVLHVLNDCFHRYIVGQCTEAVILGVLCTVGMMVLGIPYATMIGALIAFTALIPVAGAYIGAGVGAFMILTVNPVQALIFLVFLVILQQLEGNLIYPRVVGSSIGLPGMWVLLAVTLGGSLMGISGMLLFVPLTAAAYRLIREAVEKGPGVALGEDA